MVDSLVVLLRMLKERLLSKNFVDSFSLQSLASIIFMYFTNLPPTVTFGGLLGEATVNHISVIEALIGGIAVGFCLWPFLGTTFD